jgi:hypothetical protein
MVRQHRTSDAQLRRLIAFDGHDNKAIHSSRIQPSAADIALLALLLLTGYPS